MQNTLTLQPQPTPSAPTLWGNEAIRRLRDGGLLTPRSPHYPTPPESWGPSRVVAASLIDRHEAVVVAVLEARGTGRYFTLTTNAERLSPDLSQFAHEASYALFDACRRRRRARRAHTLWPVRVVAIVLDDRDDEALPAALAALEVWAADIAAGGHVPLFSMGRLLRGICKRRGLTPVAEAAFRALSALRCAWADQLRRSGAEVPLFALDPSFTGGWTSADTQVAATPAEADEERP